MTVQQQPQQPRRSQSQNSIPPLRTVTSEALRPYHQHAASISDNNSERSTSTTRYHIIITYLLDRRQAGGL